MKAALILLVAGIASIHGDPGYLGGGGGGGIGGVIVHGGGGGGGYGGGVGIGGGGGGGYGGGIGIGGGGGGGYGGGVGIGGGGGGGYGGGVGIGGGGGGGYGGGVGIGGGGGHGGGYGVDLSAGYSDYHFSWRHDGAQKYPWQKAIYYCSSLGYGWQGVSIESHKEDKLISDIIYGDKLKYIWTGGYRRGYSFQWPSGYPFYGLNWSYTGREGRPQPDNSEKGGEHCLAVLNNFYKDGIKWHDVGCHHEKPIICERRRHSHYG
ncbi:uncharacterized protein [Panulirus ornatus]|uniref:uncharacterized protein n=1 Tax=Panulirus ornatus TaxID=150431 RepID=UPI003A86CD37